LPYLLVDHRDVVQIDCLNDSKILESVVNVDDIEHIERRSDLGDRD